ncbi:MAG: hypothetical protein ABS76_14405 [Pelagibacterium sp. SCN 64-44]|nr:MAG: hypothetical protein ABS76_14405 [Pelagibacterium sp. SCN 64-44]
MTTAMMEGMNDALEGQGPMIGGKSPGGYAVLPMDRARIIGVCRHEAILLIDEPAQALRHSVVHDGGNVVAIAGDCHNAFAVRAETLGVLHHARGCIWREECPRQFFRIDPGEIRAILVRRLEE